MKKINTIEIMEGEWTGLMDTKGNPIHEGDMLYIFESETHEPLYKGVVFYQVDDNLPQFNFMPDPGEVDESENLLQKEMNSSHDIVVIGSIYDGLSELSIEKEQLTSRLISLERLVREYREEQIAYQANIDRLTGELRMIFGAMAGNKFDISKLEFLVGCFKEESAEPQKEDSRDDTEDYDPESLSRFLDEIGYVDLL